MDWIAQLVEQCTSNAKVRILLQSSVFGLRVDHVALDTHKA